MSQTEWTQAQQAQGMPEHPHQGHFLTLLPELFRRCAETLSDPKRWTSKTLARTVDGQTVDPKSVWAERWCAVGVVNKHAYALLCEERGEVYAKRYIRDLAQLGVTHLKPYVVEAASAINPDRDDLRLHEVTSINDNNRLGGYKAILAAFQSAAGVTITLSAEAMGRIETMQKRSQAAMKGWLTRRKRRDQGLVKELNLAEPSPMVFGGSLPDTDSGTTGMAQKEYAGVSAG